MHQTLGWPENTAENKTQTLPGMASVCECSWLVVSPVNKCSLSSSSPTWPRERDHENRLDVTGEPCRLVCSVLLTRCGIHMDLSGVRSFQ